MHNFRTKVDQSEVSGYCRFGSVCSFLNHTFNFNGRGMDLNVAVSYAS
jgi:hypothetical protein